MLFTEDGLQSNKCIKCSQITFNCNEASQLTFHSAKSMQKLCALSDFICAPWRECMQWANRYVSTFTWISIHFNSLLNYTIAILLSERAHWAEQLNLRKKIYSPEWQDFTILYSTKSWAFLKKEDIISFNVKFDFSKWIYPRRNMYSLGNHTALISYCTLFTTHLTLFSLFLFLKDI